MPSMKKLGKLYLYFLSAAGVFFLLQQIPSPGAAPISDSIISGTIYSIQSFFANIELKRLLLTFIMLATVYVAIETLVYLRDYAGYLYLKHKKNNMIEE